MKPLVEFGDAESLMIDHLTQAWASRAEPFAPAQEAINTSFPTLTLAGDASHLQVELDGTPVVEHPGRELATVRFTFWTGKGKRTNAKRGAAITQGLVAAHGGDQWIWHTRILTGRIRATDPDTKNEMASFTARVTLRPRAL